jgi:hypothetical protein
MKKNLPPLTLKKGPPRLALSRETIQRLDEPTLTVVIAGLVDSSQVCCPNTT